MVNILSPSHIILACDHVELDRVLTFLGQARIEYRKLVVTSTVMESGPTILVSFAPQLAGTVACYGATKQDVAALKLLLQNINYLTLTSPLLPYYCDFATMYTHRLSTNDAATYHSRNILRVYE